METNEVSETREVSRKMYSYSGRIIQAIDTLDLGVGIDGMIAHIMEMQTDLFFLNSRAHEDDQSSLEMISTTSNENWVLITFLAKVMKIFADMNANCADEVKELSSVF